LKEKVIFGVTARFSRANGLNADLIGEPSALIVLTNNRNMTSFIFRMRKSQIQISWRKV